MASILRFGGYELEPDARELRGPDGTVHLEQQVFEVLLHLVRRRERVVTKQELLDEVWGTRFVSESALTSRIKSARQAVGDNGDRQQIIRTLRGVGYRFVAPVEVVERSGDLDTAAGTGAPDMEPAIRFVEVRGGTSIAVAETGHGQPVVKVATWLTQVDKDTHDSPIWGHWVRAFSRRYRYVRYDPRGCGLSDRDLTGVDLRDLDLWVDDLARVVDSSADGPVVLLGISQGGPVAVEFAARHPERVSHLVLYGTYARGKACRGDPDQVDEARLLVDLARVGWGTDDDTFREVFARQFVPDAQSDEIAWFNAQLELTTNRHNAPLLEGAFHQLDVTETAKQVRVPTLVLHATGDRGVPFEEGRRLAGLVPGARFVPLESRNHILLQRDAAFPTFVAEIERFLRNEDAHPGHRASTPHDQGT
jgi:pimeloyl-ACP methyl ester carboxylesterase/DNA-binding winged helix-turn-helix (wHTH) protein